MENKNRWDVDKLDRIIFTQFYKYHKGLIVSPEILDSFIMLAPDRLAVHDKHNATLYSKADSNISCPVFINPDMFGYRFCGVDYKNLTTNIEINNDFDFNDKKDVENLDFWFALISEALDSDEFPEAIVFKAIELNKNGLRVTIDGITYPDYRFVAMNYDGPECPPPPYPFED